MGNKKIKIKKYFKNIFNKSFFDGMFSLSIFPPPIEREPEIKKILEQTDEEAIASDWKNVGDDLRKAIRNN